MKFAAIQDHQGAFRTSWMCRKLKVSASGFYAWSKRAVSQRTAEDSRLAVHVRAIHAASRKTYGSPRVHRELARQGMHTSRKRVMRLMRADSLMGLRKRRFKKTTDASHGRPVAPNLLDRNFVSKAPNRAWVGDITYVRTHEGWLYVATLMDLFSRRIVGWAVDDNMETNLPMKALEMAVCSRRIEPGLVHHTDRGSQYASHAYRAALDGHGMICSMSRKAQCWDNAAAESFFSRFKDDLIYREVWQTKSQARAAIVEYISCFYNAQRLHSSLGYLTPMEYEVRALRETLAA